MFYEITWYLCDKQILSSNLSLRNFLLTHDKKYINIQHIMQKEREITAVAIKPNPTKNIIWDWKFSQNIGQSLPQAAAARCGAAFLGKCPPLPLAEPSPYAIEWAGSFGTPY